MSRVSYRNYPVLKTIKKGIIESFPYYNEDIQELREKKEIISKLFDENSKGFGLKILKVSHKFLENSMLCREKLFPILKKDCQDSLEKGGIKESGTIILNHHLYSYNILLNNDISHVVVFEMFPNGGIRNIVRGDINLFTSLVENDVALKLNSIKGESYSHFITLMILSILYFKKYASVEIIESKANSKNTFAGCKYLNETDLDIEYLDSKWFTTLVKSEGFKVRGFFRLQPKKKNGEWTKELIWIDEFEKQGYNRKAGILK